MKSYPHNLQLIHKVAASTGRNMRVYIQAMKNLHGRLNDWRHERYINRLASRCRASLALGDRTQSRLYWDLMTRAIRMRSPNQVARMNRRIGVA